MADMMTIEIMVKSVKKTKVISKYVLATVLGALGLAVPASAHAWQQIPGCATWIASNSYSSSPVIIGCGPEANRQAKQLRNGAWTNLGFWAAQVAVGPENDIWALTSDGRIWKYDPVSDSVYQPNGIGMYGSGVSCAKSIAIGDSFGQKKDVYTVSCGPNNDSLIWVYDVSAGQWYQHPGNLQARHVAMYSRSQETVWSTKANGDLFSNAGGSWAHMGNASWVAEGAVLFINQIWRLEPGIGWTFLENAPPGVVLTQVAGGRAKYAIASNGSIYLR